MFSSPLKDAVIVLIIVLLFFGPKRLPALSRAIGESVKEFKGGIGKGGGENEDSKSEITATTAQAPAPAAPEAPAAPPTATSAENITA